MADRSNAQQTVNQYTQGNNVTTVQGGGQPMIVTQAASGSSIPSFGSSFPSNTDYYIQGGQPVSRDMNMFVWSLIESSTSRQPCFDVLT